MNELNLQGFDYTNGFKCSHMHRFENLSNLAINIFELNFYQDQNNWIHTLTPFEISKNGSSRVVDLLIYRNHYASTKKTKCIFRKSK